MTVIKPFTAIALALFLSVLIYFTIPSKVRMGEIYLDSFMHDKAHTMLQDVVQIDDDNIKALKRIKEYYLYKGNSKKALEAQEKLLKLRPKNVEYIKELEKLYGWNQMPYEKLLAREKILPYIASDKRSNFLNELANSHRGLRHYKDADRIFLKLRETNDLNILQNMANYYLSTQNAEMATVTLEKLANLSNRPQHYLRLLKDIYEYTGNHENAIKKNLITYGGGDKAHVRYYNSANFITNDRDLTKKNINIIWDIIRLYKLNGNRRVVKEIHRKLASTYPEDYDFRIELASMHLKDRAYSKAYKVAYKLEKETFSNVHYLGAIQYLYSSLKKYKDQIRCLRRLTQLRPKNEKYLKYLAELLEAEGKKREALHYYQKLLELREAKLKKMQKGQEAYLIEVFIPYASSDTGSQNFAFSKTKEDVLKEKINKLRLKVADLHEQLGDKKLSVEVLEKLAKDNPDNLKINNELAKRYLWYNQFDKAVPIYEKIITVDKDHPGAVAVMAEKYYRDKNYTKTLELIDRLPEENYGENKINYIAMKENSFFQLGKIEEHKKICRHIEETYGRDNFDDQLIVELNYLCMKREKENPALIAAYLETAIMKNPKLVGLGNDLIYHYLDQSDYKKALEELSKTKKEGRYTKANEEQEQYAKELEEESLRKEKIPLTAKAILRDYSGYTYIQTTIDARKRVKRGLLAKVSVDLFKAIDGDSSGYALLQPYLFANRGPMDFRLGYSFDIGDKKSEDVPLWAEVYYTLPNKLYSVFSYHNSQIEMDTKTIAKSRNINHKVAKLYLYHAPLPLFNYEAELKYIKHFIDSDEATEYQLYLEGLHELPRDDRYAFGLRNYNSSRSNTSDSLRSIYVAESWSIYAVGKWHLNPQFEETKGAASDLRTKFAIGKELLRDDVEGILVNALIEYEKRFNPLFNAKAFFNYFRESSSVSTSDNWELGLTCKYLY